jgi:hypothetical protein
MKSLNLESARGLTYTFDGPEGYPNGKEAVLKTAGRKALQVRILSPPPMEKCVAAIADSVKRNH